MTCWRTRADQEERHEARPARRRPTATRKSAPTRHAATLPAPAAIAVRSATSAVASLSSDSPSRIVTIRRGRPIRRPIAVAATASGGATTAPIASAAHQSMPGQQRVDEPRRRPTVVKTTSPTTSSRIGAPVGVEVDQRGLDAPRRTAAAAAARAARPRAEVHRRARRAGTTPTTPTTISTSGAGKPNALGQRRAGEHDDRQRDQQERDLHPDILAMRRDGAVTPRCSATQRIGSPQPSSSTPCRPSASTTSVRRCAAKVSTWAIIPP